MSDSGWSTTWRDIIVPLLAPAHSQRESDHEQGGAQHPTPERDRLPSHRQHRHPEQPMTRSLESYRELLRALIDNDGPCQSPTCGITMLGHLLAGAPPHLVDLVRAEDPEEPPR